MASFISQCLSFSLLLAASALTDIKIPINFDIDIGNGTVLTLGDLQCPIISGGSTAVYYNTSGISIEVLEAMNITCEMEIDINHVKSTTLVFGLTSKENEALTIVTEADPDKPCYSSKASMPVCTLAPQVTDLRFSPPDATLDGVLKIIADWVVNPMVTKAICDIGAAVTTQLTNNTELPRDPFPSFRLGARSMHTWPLTSMISTIVNSLPYKLLGMHIDMGEPSNTGIELNVTMLEAINISTPSFALYVPSNVLLSADVGFDMLVCNDAGWKCFISNGIKLPSIRTWGGGQMDRLMNNYLSPLLSDVVDKIFSGGLELNIPEDETSEDPPMVMLLVLGPVLAILATACVGYSVMRHSKTPVLDIHKNPISLKRVFIEDIFVTAMCFTCMFLFAWSNVTTAASVVVGDELTVYTFSLVNSVEDMWKAGLYPLSALICFFSGVYPYVKLVTIVVFSVILQRPQNKILRFVDNVGKYSLLDSFVMTILKTGLEINGIATVKSHLSFYVFVFATLGSIFIGNYATHGWRRQTQLRYDDDEREMIIQRTSANSRLSKGGGKGVSTANNGANSLNYIGVGFVDHDYLNGSGTTPNYKQSGTGLGGGAAPASKSEFDNDLRKHLMSSKGLEGIEETLNLKWYEIWEWQLAVPLGIVMACISGVACYYPSVTYRISGFATVLTGAEKPCSLWDLFLACDPILLTVGLFTVVFAPIAYVATYPHCRFLAAWGATDVFLLSCVAGLLQLKQFISFTLGEGMDGLYTASCDLQWPLALWALSVLIQWLFTFKQTLGIPGVPTLTKIRLAMAIRDGDSSGDGSSQN